MNKAVHTLEAMLYRIILFFVFVSVVMFPVFDAIAANTEFTTVGANVPIDIDGDGMPNTWELTYGLDPGDPIDAGFDLDSDGLVNLEEYNRATDPSNPDTDGGGLGDGDEVDQGKDPLNPADDNIPVISNIQVSSITETSAIVTWQTDVLSDSLVSFSQSSGVYTNLVNDATFVTSHSVSLVGLTSGTIYYFKITSENGSGGSVVSVNDVVQNFTTLDLTAPNISNVAAVPSLTGAAITWLTSENATTQVRYGTTASLDTTTSKDLSLVSAHTVVLSGLVTDTVYYYQVVSEDAFGNEAVSSVGTFKTDATPVDAIAPIVSDVVVVDNGGGNITVTFKTNENAQGYVAFGSTESLAIGNTSLSLTAESLTHSVDIPYVFMLGQKYYFRAYAKDGSGNIGASVIVSYLVPSLVASPTPLEVVGEVTPVPEEAIPGPIEDRFQVSDPSGDLDGDGLTNYEEYLYGTNPQNADTDGDGLSDYVEVKKYGTNPNKRDSDDDTLTDLGEILEHKTDPLKWDTDDGGMSDGDEVDSGLNPLDPSDDLKVVVQAYLGDSVSDLFVRDNVTKIEIPERMDLSLKIRIPFSYTGVVIEYGDTVFFTEEIKNDFKLKSPGKPGIYLLKVQVLSANGDVAQFTRFVEVKKRGSVKVVHEGFFKSYYKYFPFLRDRNVAGALVTLYRQSSSSGEWAVFDQARFGIVNPQHTDGYGEYVFVASGDRYRLVVQANEGVEEAIFTNTRSVIVNKDFVFYVNGDFIFVVILLFLLLSAVSFLYWLYWSRRPSKVSENYS